MNLPRRPRVFANPVNTLFTGGHYDNEKIWIARFDFLKASGYLLRPRYRPGWVRSWNDSERHVDSRPDGIPLRVSESQATLKLRTYSLCV